MREEPLLIDYALGRRLLAAAIRAPSSHNTQPWRFRVRDARIDLLADRDRALPVNDPHGRELAISCGAALFNLQVAAAAEGFTPIVSLLPGAHNPDLLASLALLPGTPPPPHWPGLHAAIDRRHTCRKRFAQRRVESPLLAQLVAAAADHGAWLAVLVDPPQRHALAALVAEGDALQWQDARWRQELAAWMHPASHGDGLTVPLLASPFVRQAVRSFDLGDGVGERDRALADGAPVLAVLGTLADSHGDWLRAGQALQQLLLTAAAAGVQASYLNQPIQIAALRGRVAQAIAHAGEPQLVLRLGYPLDALEPAPRRPLADVIADY
jgi:hypothetical protein